MGIEFVIRVWEVCVIFFYYICLMFWGYCLMCGVLSGFGGLFVMMVMVFVSGFFVVVGVKVDCG